MNQLFHRLRAVLALLVGNKDPEHSHGQRRARQIGRGFLGSAAQKTTGLLVSVLSVPLAIEHLGDERYGLWMAITSLLSWLALSDLGLSYSLSLSVATAYGRDDQKAAQQSVSSAFYALSFVALALGAVFLLVAPWIPWNSLFNVVEPLTKSELVPALMVAFILFVINFPLSIPSRVLSAYQEFATVNAFGIAINLLTLAALVIACWLQAGLPVLIGCFSGASVIVGIVLAVWLFQKHKPWLAPRWKAFDLRHATDLIRKGLWFFANSITWAMVSQIGTLIIVHELGAASVTPYSVAQRLFSYSLLLQSMVGGLLSLTYTEALAKGDHPWILKTLGRHFWLSCAASAVLCAGLYLAAPSIISVWAGPEAVPSNGVLIWMALWNFLLGLTTPFATLLFGLGRIKMMTIYSAVTAVLNLVLALFWVKTYGMVGVVAASTVAIAVINLPACIIDVRHWLKHIPKTTSQAS
ncbi:hypothetical protein FEM03_11385 [Phragmitibacter flavus]|uniref:Uncharacterized protein n=1 Tax=Phragmitibacter flavus TaxID=2576071 RepID=A0A5R8KF26_9BACT|nr:oligosaccharide flippase family protein [Phragmitibacter flavus]TLD70900.1 hypothetical protein FEM03_11385 [Phragmitibacter flavus]